MVSHLLMQEKQSITLTLCRAEVVICKNKTLLSLRGRIVAAAIQSFLSSLYTSPLPLEWWVARNDE
jgi:hypothetical protein